MELFPRDRIAGVFRGFTQGGLEFHADLLLPYQPHFHSTPMHGQFLLVQLENPEEAVLGRITSFAAEGRLSYGAGEEFALRAMHEARQIPDDLREEYLRYRISIRVLGVVRQQNGGLTFVPSHRRLPHVGSVVAFPSPEILAALVGQAAEGAAPIGHFALGEFIYAGADRDLERLDWMQVLQPEIPVHFPMSSLVSRRSFIFARAGFGKSNLNKLLFSQLYAETPTAEKRGGRRVPVGTLIFDPDGEYFWPDDKGRPGLCDVPHLEERLVVFTDRRGPSAFYQSFVAAGVKMDIRRMRPADVIAIALPPDRQDQQNVRKLRGLGKENWRQLVDLIHAKGNAADTDVVCRLLNLDPQRQDVEAFAARSNMTQIVHQLHDPGSRLMEMLRRSLEEGCVCVVDLSQMRGSQGLTLAGLILRHFFNHNQGQFTEAEPATIPIIAVIEEAQAVLNERAAAAAPFIEWVKEGRKYDLGALLITQQPGSIPDEILSQGDNWFLFHLLSAGDLTALQRANAHFSQDILSSLLNEPIPGQGVFWSSVAATPYPIPLRVLSFETLFTARDPDYTGGAAHTPAVRLRALLPPPTEVAEGERDPELGDAPQPDMLVQYEVLAAEGLRRNREVQQLQQESGMKWGRLGYLILDLLPEGDPDRNEIAFDLVRPVLVRLFGAQDQGWRTWREQDVLRVRALRDMDEPSARRS